MPQALSRRGLLGAATLLHAPFVAWAVSGGFDVANLRSAIALSCCALLLWTRRPWQPRTQVEGPWLALVAALSALSALAGLAHPGWWALSWLALGAAGALSTAAPARHGVLVGLWACAYPFERVLASHLDASLQAITALLALPVVRLTGLPVTLEHSAAGPVLAGDQLQVTVTSLCAGSQTLLTLITLGWVVAEVFVRRSEHKLLFVALTPAFGLAGNVLRVAISTHAAKRWGQDPDAWAWAHDGVGYVTFALTYVALFSLARRLRHPAHAALASAIDATATASATTQSPQRT